MGDFNSENSILGDTIGKGLVWFLMVGVGLFIGRLAINPEFDHDAYISILVLDTIITLILMVIAYIKGINKKPEDFEYKKRQKALDDEAKLSGARHKYCQHCGAEIDFDCVVCTNCGKQVAELRYSNSNNEQSGRHSKWVAFLLCFFFGALGLHHFYAGRYVMGIVYLFTLGFFGFGVLVDLILILTGLYCDRYGLGLV